MITRPDTSDACQICRAGHVLLGNYEYCPISMGRRVVNGGFEMADHCNRPTRPFNDYPAAVAAWKLGGLVAVAAMWPSDTGEWPDHG